MSNLKKSLKIQNKMGDQVSRAFLQAMVHLIGGYRDALRLDIIIAYFNARGLKLKIIV